METAARSYCAGRLSAAGYLVTQERFRFTSRPARVTPRVVGVFAGLVAFLVAHLAIVHVRYVLALGVLAVAIGVGIREYRSVLSPRAIAEGNESGTNLIATRGTPSVWLVAHIDSKSQTIPMLLRIASSVGVVVGTIGLFITLLVGAVSLVTGRAAIVSELDVSVLIFAAVVIVASIPLALCSIRNRSRGALDNASGVAAVLLAAEQTTHDGIGIAITSAEELGLAGAQAFASARSPSVAVNCDTIDDDGQFVAMRSTRRPNASAVDAITTAAKNLDILVTPRRTLPGVVTDATALARAGWDVVTLSRGNLATLGRVHTSRDTPERIAGTGIALAAHLLRATIEELA